MTDATTLLTTTIARPWSGLRLAAPALACGALAWGLLFHTEVATAVSIWQSSTAYGHCIFVLPIALYLAWDRRDSIRGTAVSPLPLAAVLAVPLAFAWLIAERVGVMEMRQLIAVALFEVLCLAVLGIRMFRALAVPLLYLFFLVPFGAFLTPALQAFTARFIVTGLNLLGIPNFADNFIIEIPEGTFYVAEACAGLRFLIAAVAFGVLYACLIYRSPVRRTVFILASIAIPIVANGFRGLGIVALGHVIGSAEAAVADHIIYGWLFFSVVILLLIAAGLPFREDGAPYEPVRGPRGWPASEATARGMGLAAGAAMLLASMGPAAAALIERAANSAVTALDPKITLPSGCTEQAPEPPAQRGEKIGASPGSLARTHAILCGRNLLTMTIVTLPARANPAVLIGAMRRSTGELEAEDADSSTLRIPGIEPAAWRLVTTSNPRPADRHRAVGGGGTCPKRSEATPGAGVAKHRWCNPCAGDGGPLDRSGGGAALAARARGPPASGRRVPRGTNHAGRADRRPVRRAGRALTSAAVRIASVLCLHRRLTYTGAFLGPGT